MEDLPDLIERARDLRTRISNFLGQFGDMVPEVRELHEELARIEQHLEALGKHAPGEDLDE